MRAPLHFWLPRYACYEDARLVPRVGVASALAEGFLALPFSRRDKVHTGHHSAVPPRLAESGLLHQDGSTPDMSRLQRRASAAEAKESRSRLPEQVRVRLTKLKTLQRNGIDAYPVGSPPSHTSRRPRARATASSTYRSVGKLSRSVTISERPGRASSAAHTSL